MHKKVAVVLVVMMVFIFSGMAFAQPAELPNVPGPKPSLVALGDSITAGYGLERNTNRVSRSAYPQRLGDEIDYRVTNLAVSGMTTSEVRDAVLYNNRYRNAIANADMIIVNVGGADLLRFVLEYINPYTPEPDPDMFVATLASSIAGILEEIGALNPDVPVLLFNIYEPYPVTYNLPGEDFAVLNFLLGSVNTVISGLAEIPNVYYVDAYAAYALYPGEKIEKAMLLFIDEVHPSEQGQQVLFEAALNVVEGNELLDAVGFVPPGLMKKAMGQ